MIKEVFDILWASNISDYRFFIILLCFFIVINSLSTFEQIKTQDVLQSLQFAFAGKLEGDDVLPSVQASTTETFEKGDTLDKINALFSAQIKTFKASKNRLGTEMMVRLPLAEFEDSLRQVSASGVSAERAFEREGGAFLPTLVSLIETAESKIPYRMDILLNIPENPAIMTKYGAEQSHSLLKQAAFFSSALERAGMPRKFMSSGFAQGHAENAYKVISDEQFEPYVELYFRRYTAFDPLAGDKVSTP